MTQGEQPLTSGSFTGVIVADDVVRIHGEIIGMVVVLSDSPSARNCIGNGSGDVLYAARP